MLRRRGGKWNTELINNEKFTELILNSKKLITVSWMRQGIKNISGFLY